MSCVCEHRKNEHSPDGCAVLGCGCVRTYNSFECGKEIGEEAASASTVAAIVAAAEALDATDPNEWRPARWFAEWVKAGAWKRPGAGGQKP